MVRKALIIEDEPEIRAILALSLEHVCGWETVLADDGIDGLEKALAEDPDVIVLDAMMPRLDGYATCRRIRQDERLKDIPVVFLTAKTDPREKDRAMRAGASGWVAKPFDPLSLAGQIAEIANSGANRNRHAVPRRNRNAHQ